MMKKINNSDTLLYDHSYTVKSLRCTPKVQLEKLHHDTSGVILHKCFVKVEKLSLSLCNSYNPKTRSEHERRIEGDNSILSRYAGDWKLNPNCKCLVKVNRVSDTVVNYFLNFAILSSVPSFSLCQNDVVSDSGGIKDHVLSSRSTKKSHPKRRKKHKCVKCPYSSNSRRKLKSHAAKKHAIKQTHVCKVCQQRFAVYYNLLQHERTHFPKRPGKNRCAIANIRQPIEVEAPRIIRRTCDLCYYVTMSRRKLRKHVLHMHSVDVKYECNICHKQFAIYFNLKRHVKTHTKKKKVADNLVLDIEPKTTCNRDNFSVNIPILVNHDYTKEPTEDIAPKTPVSDLSVKRGPFQLSCQDCDKIFKSSLSWKKHKAVVHKEKLPFVCEVCGRRSHSFSRLKRHMILQHRLVNKNKYKCDSCSRTFFSRSIRDAHARTHIVALKHRCNLCNFKGKSEYHLLSHRLLHAKQRPSFVCDICNEAFTYHNSLVVHRGNVHQVKVEPLSRASFNCDKCDSSFNYKTSLVAHRRTMHEHRSAPYACDKCKMKFYKHKLYIVHLRKIHRERVKLNCLHCEYRTTSKKKLRHHIVAIHNEYDKTNVGVSGERDSNAVSGEDVGEVIEIKSEQTDGPTLVPPLLQSETLHREFLPSATTTQPLLLLTPQINETTSLFVTTTERSILDQTTGFDLSGSDSKSIFETTGLCVSGIDTSNLVGTTDLDVSSNLGETIEPYVSVSGTTRLCVSNTGTSNLVGTPGLSLSNTGSSNRAGTPALSVEDTVANNLVGTPRLFVSNTVTSNIVRTRGFHVSNIDTNNTFAKNNQVETRSDTTKRKRDERTNLLITTKPTGTVETEVISSTERDIVEKATKLVNPENPFSLPIFAKLVLVPVDAEAPFVITHRNTNKEIDNNAQVRAFQCLTCSKFFKSDFFFTKHCAERHNNLQPFKCKSCPYTTTYFRDIQDHRLSHQPCSEETTLAHKVNPNVPKNKGSGIKFQPCVLCEKQYPSRKMLEEHYQAKHTDGKMYYCTQCTYSSHIKGLYSMHVLTAHGSNLHICKLCGINFSSEFNLDLHASAHHNLVKTNETSSCAFNTPSTGIKVETTDFDEPEIINMHPFEIKMGQPDQDHADEGHEESYVSVFEEAREAVDISVGVKQEPLEVEQPHETDIFVNSTPCPTQFNNSTLPNKMFEVNNCGQHGESVNAGTFSYCDKINEQISIASRTSTSQRLPDRTEDYVDDESVVLIESQVHSPITVEEIMLSSDSDDECTDVDEIPVTKKNVPGADFDKSLIDCSHYAYICWDCGKNFKYKTHFANHRVHVHQDLKPFFCDFCQFKTRTSSTLRVHQKTCPHSNLPKTRDKSLARFIKKQSLKIQRLSEQNTTLR